MEWAMIVPLQPQEVALCSLSVRIFPVLSRPQR
jgi:hypothetical protein